jgi:hypothetical protein
VEEPSASNVPLAATLKLLNAHGRQFARPLSGQLAVPIDRQNRDGETAHRGFAEIAMRNLSTGIRKA